MKTTAFIPIKLNNERLPGKNTMSFDGGTLLCHFLQKTLLQVQEIDEIIVFCSDDRIQEYLLPGVKYLKRPAQVIIGVSVCLFCLFVQFNTVYIKFGSVFCIN